MPPHLTFLELIDIMTFVQAYKLSSCLLCSFNKPPATSKYSHPAPYSQIPSTYEIPHSLFPECALISFVPNCNIIKSTDFHSTNKDAQRNFTNKKRTTYYIMV